MWLVTCMGRKYGFSQFSFLKCPRKFCVQMLVFTCTHIHKTVQWTSIERDQKYE